MHALKRKADALLFAGNELCPEVNAKEKKYVFMSLEMSGEKHQSVRRGIKSFENVENFKYLGKTINQN